jgi:hypothetical protein
VEERDGGHDEGRQQVAHQSDSPRSHPVEQWAAERLEDDERRDLGGRDETGLRG